MKEIKKPDNERWKKNIPQPTLLPSSQRIQQLKVRCQHPLHQQSLRLQSIPASPVIFHECHFDLKDQKNSGIHSTMAALDASNSNWWRNLGLVIQKVIIWYIIHLEPSIKFLTKNQKGASFGYPELPIAAE